MKISKEAINFNKEFLFGEVGAIIGAPLASYIGSRFTSSIDTIATVTVIGAAIGASLFWLGMRVHDRLNQIKTSKKNFVKDLLYITPIASLFVFLIYYPSLFLLSRHLLENDYRAVSSAIISQMSAYVLFLSAINIYRYAVLKLTGRKL
ncbi:MAG: hypothetical protein WD876_02040 [Candidatus Pacearchaeota archaeon]